MTAEPTPTAFATTRRDRISAEELAALRWLAREGADRRAVRTTSREVGEAIGVSQQAADRYLVRLEHRGLLTRSLAARRQSVRLTADGLSVLRAEYLAYRRLFEGPTRLALSGAVVSGLGEGRYYLSQPGYVLQFAERLGYTPYPGTLNVKVTGEAQRLAEAIRGLDGVRIDGFQANGRTFGGAVCLPATLNGTPCHLIRPDRTHYADVLEFISVERLRDRLRLEDGSIVEIAVEER